VLKLALANGRKVELDLRSELHGEVFEQLLDYELFARVEVGSDFDTVFWPNGADLSPEFLAEAISSASAH